MQELDEKTLQGLRTKAKRSLFFFARAILGFKDITPEIHGPLCRMLEGYETDRRRLVVLPRTWFKSTVASVAYPIWRSVRDCNVRLLIAQNTMTNAKKKIASIKNIFETNAILQALFPNLMPRGDRPWSSECLTVNRTLPEPEGTFEPAGTGTAVTSRHYDEIIEDDTVAPDFDAMTGEVQQPTNLEIEKAIGFHKMCYPLLLHPSKSVRTVVGTRWAENDLIGWIRKNASNYKMYSRAAREKNGLPATKEQGGTAIWDRFNEEVLDELAGPQGVGMFMFLMLYLNTTTTAVNQVFKRSYINYYANLPKDLLCCTSIDPAPSKETSTTQDTDYNAVVTTGIKPSTGEVWVVNYNQERCSPGRLIDILFNHYRAYHPLVVKVETTAYQYTLVYWITQRQNKTGERFFIDEVKNAKTSKAARILGLQPWFSAGLVRIRPDQTDLERELLAFDPSKKAGVHDDIIDALSVQIPFWNQVCDQNRQAEETKEADNPFSGSSIIKGLLDRVDQAGQFPYDVGIMQDRLIATLPEKYHEAIEQVKHGFVGHEN